MSSFFVTHQVQLSVHNFTASLYITVDNEAAGDLYDYINAFIPEILA